MPDYLDFFDFANCEDAKEPRRNWCLNCTKDAIEYCEMYGAFAASLWIQEENDARLAKTRTK